MKKNSLENVTVVPLTPSQENEFDFINEAYLVYLELITSH